MSPFLLEERAKDAIEDSRQRDWTAAAIPRPGNCICPITIGRSVEFATLQAFLTQSSGLLLISGEAGIGKSRLVREARSLAHDRGIRVLEGRCFEADRALPFAPAMKQTWSSPGSRHWTGHGRSSKQER